MDISTFNDMVNNSMSDIKVSAQPLPDPGV